MPRGADLPFFLCVVGIALVVGLGIGAVLLRTAVALYNAMAGGESSPSGVPAPAFGYAMVIIFVTSLVNGVVGFLIGMATALAAGGDAKAAGPIAQLISLPINLVLMAGILSAMLPTTFGRAILVTLCYYLVAILLVVVLVVIAVVVIFALKAA